MQTNESAKDGCFAAAVRPQKGEGLRIRDLEIERSDRLQRAEALGEGLKANNGFVRRAHPMRPAGRRESRRLG